MSDGGKGRGFNRKDWSGLKAVDRDVIVFAFFLVLSFIFWYLNGLSREVESEVRYPVRYINPPKDRALTGNLPAKLTFSLKGPGYSILKLKMSGSRAPVVVDMSRLDYKVLPQSELQNYYIHTSVLKDVFHKQLRADFEILGIDPDTLRFSFDLTGSRRIAVMPDIEIDTDDEFFVKGSITTDPDSVEVFGPMPLIDTIEYVKTKYKRFTGINRTFSKNILLESSKDYTLSSKRVRVSVPIEQFTEARFDLEITLLNKPDSIDIKLFPDIIDVSLQVAVSDYKGIFESNIQAVVDISSVDLLSADKLPVTIINVPGSVKTLRYNPKELDYIIERRAK